MLYPVDCKYFLRFWVDRWSTFPCVNCFVLENREMRCLDFCGEAQKA